MYFQCEWNRNQATFFALEVLFLLEEFSSSILFLVKCVLSIMRRFSMKFPVTHFKFPGENVPVSPAKETAWLSCSSVSILLTILILSNSRCFLSSPALLLSLNGRFQGHQPSPLAHLLVPPLYLHKYEFNRLITIMSQPNKIDLG